MARYETLERGRDPLSACADEGILDRIHRATYRLLDLTDPRSGGSCVAVEIGQRLLLATAAHVLPKGHRLALLRKDGSSGMVVDFRRIERDEDADVGFLELDRSIADCVRGSCINALASIGRISPTRQEFVWVNGYPGEFARRVREGAVAFLSFTVSGVTIPFSTRPQDIPTTLGRDRMVFEFDRTDQLMLLLPENVGRPKPVFDRPPPQLPGISGSGIWAHAHQCGEGIWIPSPMLVGIQTGQLGDGKYVCGCPIARWLELVARAFPELKTEVTTLRRTPFTRTKFVEHSRASA